MSVLLSPQSVDYPIVPRVRLHRRVEGTTVENWIGRVGLPVYFALLLVSALWPDSGVSGSMPGLAVSDSRSVAGLLRLAALVAGPILLDVGRFAPLGMLAALALPRRRRRSTRYLYVVAPAVLMATLLASILLEVEAGPLRHPGVFELLVAFLFCAVGAWIGMSWLRGLRARIFIIPKLIVAALVLPVAAGSFMYLTLQSHPLRLDSPKVTSEERRRLYGLVHGKNPKKLEPGETVTLSLNGRDINDLLAWSASMASNRHHAQVDLTGSSPVVMISAISPLARGDAKYINIIARARVRISNGALDLEIRRLRVGWIEVPGVVLSTFSPVVTQLANGSRQLRPFLDPVRDLTVNKAGFSATYGRAELPSGIIASLLNGGDDALDAFQGAVTAQARHLLASGARGLGPDERFAASIETAFRYARERSTAGNATAENRAAIVALALVLGHKRVERLAGQVLGEADWRSAAAFQGTTLWHRKDWTQHFFVSAALSTLSTQGSSDAAGLLKEDLDSDGGSGFSFGDLLADRSGTTFALAATRDEASARAIQDRLAQGFRAGDFIPDGTDLPEDLTIEQLQTRFGGVGGEGFRRVTGEIERRLADCVGYRPDSAPPGSVGR